MTQISGNADVPDMGRRQFLNLITFGTITGVALGALYPVVKYFIPAGSGGAGGGLTAKDKLGNDIIVSDQGTYYATTQNGQCTAKDSDCASATSFHKHMPQGIFALGMWLGSNLCQHLQNRRANRGFHGLQLRSCG